MMFINLIQLSIRGDVARSWDQPRRLFVSIVVLLFLLVGCGGGSSSSGTLSSAYSGTYVGVETTTYYDWEMFSDGYSVSDAIQFTVQSDGSFFSTTVRNCERGGVQQNTASVVSCTATYSFSAECLLSGQRCVVTYDSTYQFASSTATSSTSFSFDCDVDNFWGTVRGAYQKTAS